MNIILRKGEQAQIDLQVAYQSALLKKENVSAKCECLTSEASLGVDDLGPTHP